ncbi:MAG: type II toxin-antitoxin system VapC family toxin [Candidatus Protistobacter heckmanni]|nr:type II toxin-antitoxin system VapC family toxin [Candidatus Protistobacter heckmanni]
MILADTSVWIDHLHAADPELVRLLCEECVLAHPFVIGEIALGSLRNRNAVLSVLADLLSAAAATPEELLYFIESERLTNRSIGYVDAALLASARLTPGVRLWTRDQHLSKAAQALGVASTPAD